MPNQLTAWAPAVVVVTGGILMHGVDRQRDMELAGPLEAAVPAEVAGAPAVTIDLTEAERIAAGVDDYVMRAYRLADSTTVNVYIGYYGRQTQGHTIHSPKNCLPGNGWDAVGSSIARVSTPRGTVPVNRYILQRESEQVLVLYWYQGRGRVAADEYLVKWHLLRDAALRGRTEEALVRIVVPVTGAERDAWALAADIAADVIPALEVALPT